MEVFVEVGSPPLKYPLREMKKEAACPTLEARRKKP